MAGIVSVIGFFSSAHSPDKMTGRLSSAVADLKNELNEFEVNTLGFLCDDDAKAVAIAQKKIETALKSSSSLVIILSGWAKSTPILRLIRHHLHIPIIIWALAGYYESGELIAPAAAAGASLLRNTLNVLNADYYIVYDNLKEHKNTSKVTYYIRFSDSVKRLKDINIASIGYACSNLYPFMYDGNIIKKYTGLSVDNIELLYLERLAAKIDESAIQKHMADFLEKVSFKGQIKEDEIHNFSKYSIALERLVSEGNYDAVTIKCGSGPGEILGFTPCMLLSYISEGIDAICECDVNNLALQIIIRQLTGHKATFLEIFEFYKSSVLMASCGFSPFSLCSGDCIIARCRDWGGAGGIMNISPLKTGDISMLTMFAREGRMVIQFFKGFANSPEKFQEEGWEFHKGPAIPALDITLDSGNEIFKKNIRGPHYIIVHKNVSEEIKMFCKLKGIIYESF
jgi:L-fucose isomerase-like protein